MTAATTEQKQDLRRLSTRVDEITQSLRFVDDLLDSGQVKRARSVLMAEIEKLDRIDMVLFEASA